MLIQLGSVQVSSKAPTDIYGLCIESWDLVLILHALVIKSHKSHLINRHSWCVCS